MLHAQLAALVLVATALIVAGCGGSSKTQSSSSASAGSGAGETGASSELTNSELIAKADAICARANAELSSSSVKSEQDYATVMPQDAAYFESEAGQLRGLKPPAGMEKDWNQIVANFQVIAEDIAKVGEYAQKKTLARGAALYKAANEARQQIFAIAKRNGFKVCSQS